MTLFCRISPLRWKRSSNCRRPTGWPPPEVSKRTPQQISRRKPPSCSSLRRLNFFLGNLRPRNVIDHEMAGSADDGEIPFAVQLQSRTRRVFIGLSHDDGAFGIHHRVVERVRSILVENMEIAQSIHLRLWL